jgi:hypothetical protein
MENEFQKFILRKHPDPDSMLMQDNYGKDGSLRTGYEANQIEKLAEEYAEKKVIEYQIKKMIERGLNAT